MPSLSSIVVSCVSPFSVEAAPAGAVGRSTLIASGVEIDGVEVDGVEVSGLRAIGLGILVILDRRCGAP